MRQKIYKWFFLFLSLPLALVARGEGGTKKVGLCVTATNKYIEFIPHLIKSANQHFLEGHHVTFFVFTDGEIAGEIAEEIAGENIVCVPHSSSNWQSGTMDRFQTYFDHKHLFKGFDYMYALDADMLFVNRVNREIFGERVATLHPGYAIKRHGHPIGSFEEREYCRAFVPAHKRKRYFAGGFYGGSTKEFNRLNEVCSQNIVADRKDGIVAIWQDESHLNCYFADNPPSRTLMPGYCYTSSDKKAEQWKIGGQYKPRILALEKDHILYKNGENS